MCVYVCVYTCVRLCLNVVASFFTVWVKESMYAFKCSSFKRWWKKVYMFLNVAGLYIYRKSPAGRANIVFWLWLCYDNHIIGDWSKLIDYDLGWFLFSWYTYPEIRFESAAPLPIKFAVCHPGCETLWNMVLWLGDSEYASIFRVGELLVSLLLLDEINFIVYNI